MEGTVISFRRGINTQKARHFLIQPLNCKDKEDATKLVGKSVTWTSSSGKIITGKVASAHGNKGIIRVIFEKGLPGQSITQKVEIK